MASLTPGLLSKLLDNAGNKKVRVTGEHRSALLQVIEILPSLADDPWKSRGFFLKVSDSLHSAYVSVSNEDMDLIYSDKIQLGQFVYVSRLDSGSPVPVLRGLKPVPKRRPCVGNPKDLVSSDLLPIRASVVDFKKEKKGCKNVKKDLDFKARRRDSLGNGKKLGGMDMRRLSLDCPRRIWDQAPIPKNATSPTKPFKSSKNVHSDKKALSKNDSLPKPPSLNVSPLKSKNEISSPKAIATPLKRDFKSKTDCTISSVLVKVALSSKTWSDQRISWHAISPAIRNLGKETVGCRNAAFSAAVHALEEASAAESVIRCMQAFAELCESSQKVSSGSLVEQYLDLHQCMQRALMMVNSLFCASLPEAKSSNCSSLQCLVPDVCKTSTNKNAASWIYAAMETNLSKFSLFKKPEKSEIVDSDDCHYVILENTPDKLNSENQSPQNKPRSRNHSNFLSDSGAKRVPSPSMQHISATKKMNPEREDCPKGRGLKETVNLAKKLLLVSCEWFLKYMEDLLDAGFGMCTEDSSEMACLLRQLKRVDRWLDDLAIIGVKVDGRIEELKKKLYGFLLEHVDAAVFAGK